MKKLPVGRGRYARDLGDLISGTVLADRAIALQSAKSTAVIQARSYRRHPPSKRAMTVSVTATQRQAFLDCWTQRPAAVEAIRRRVFAALPTHHQGRCPYCALPSQPADLDHFREKTLVPELALYDRNLVPSCPVCNRNRGATFDANGTQHVIHFYDDIVDEVPDVLRARIEEDPNGSAVAHFSVVSDSSPAAELYRRHFATLGLEVRYRVWASTVMLEYADRVGPSQVHTFPQEFAEEAGRHQARWGPNEPRAALLRAMAATPQVFVKLLRSR